MRARCCSFAGVPATAMLLVAATLLNLTIALQSSLSRAPSTRGSPAFRFPSLRTRSRRRLLQKLHASSDSSSIDHISLQRHFSFPLDDWQLSAGSSILAGHNVIVCAPTGAGKTVVGEMALHIALEKKTSSIYTTPLKALSNQKFGEMRKVFGVDSVGLTTGDVCIRRGADVTIMTTEVYRNLAWRANTGNIAALVGDEEVGIGVDLQQLERASSREDFSDLSSNSIVVLDEFHYMGQKGRGSVWEECVIFNPPHCQIVGLSATLPNARRLCAWMESVTGRKSVLIEAGGKRPVPTFYLFATKRHMAPLFRDESAGPGSPRGLLGLRGDGEAANPPLLKGNKKKKKKKGFVPSQLQGIGQNVMPSGLDLHPTLQTAQERQMASIERRVQRIVERESYDDYDGYKKGSAISPREQRRMRESMLKAELRKSVPSIHSLVSRLESKNLLPAIFFIFSRAGCDSAAEMMCESLKTKAEELASGSSRRPVRSSKRKGKMLKGKGGRGRGRRQSNNNAWDLNEDELSMIQDDEGRNFRSDLLDKLLSDELDSLDEAYSVEDADEGDGMFSDAQLQYYSEVGLLSYGETKEVASRVKHFNTMNPDIAFEDGVIERLLCGLGSHHAGILPAHKAFVETLFRLELMRAVFATETLAAGINMPARTTVICSMAKRSDVGMELLETSNMLQMAGRAGRRGMDDKGYCVISSTPFEGPDDAIQILTSELKPVVSQFAPSYALALNLVERGRGELNVARALVQKSFGVWENEQRDKDIERALKELALDVDSDEPEEKFLNALQLHLEQELLQAKDGGSSNSKIAKLASMVDVLADGKKLNKVSKKFSGLQQILELEESTLNYLEQELREMQSLEIDLPAELIDANQQDLMAEIKTQQRRVSKSQREVNDGFISTMAKVANNRIRDESDGNLKRTLSALRLADENSLIDGVALEPRELNTYIKTASKSNRRPLLDRTTVAPPGSDEEDNSWSQMLALVKVLEAYGCLIAASENSAKSEHNAYTVTEGGQHVGFITSDNSLWQLSALGGSYDVACASSELDNLKDALVDFQQDDSVDSMELEESSSTIPKPQQEAETLLGHLCDMTHAELAGYVSALCIDSPRRADSALESFQRLTKTQQRVVQGALLSLERLVEVQRQLGVDDSFCKCQLELSSCEVVTAWANDCSWNDALTISGAQPGDLVRILSRVLDTLRQIANLPYIPARSLDGNARLEAPGVHPTIRALCREAANAMDRYPVKDILPFEEEEEEEGDTSIGDSGVDELAISSQEDIKT